MAGQGDSGSALRPQSRNPNTTPGGNRNKPASTGGGRVTNITDKPKDTSGVNVESLPSFAQGDVRKRIADQQAQTDYLRGRTLIEDADYEELLSMGYDPYKLNDKYLTKSDEAMIKKYGADTFYNAPARQAPVPAVDQGTNSLLMQQALMPYLQQLNADFQGQREGWKQTNNNLLNQMDQTYRPFMEANTNAMYAQQDRGWMNTIRDAAVVPLLEEFLANAQANKQAAQSGQGGIGGMDPAALQALLSGQG